MEDLQRILIECAATKSCSKCEAYPGCGGMLEMLLRAAKKIGELEDRQRWRPASEPPKDESIVLVKVSGVYGNLHFKDAVEIGTYYGAEDGWELETWSEWENPGVREWMPLPD